jgi:serine phosphatase RsbU (regulator of sigma subunit)
MQLRELGSIPLFANLPAEELQHLVTTLTASHFPAGKVLLKEGSSDDKFYILMEGKVEVVKSLGSPEERILGVREPGTLLGEMSLFTQRGSHTASVRSLDPLHLLRVTRTELDALLHRQPMLAYNIISLLSHRLSESENLTILDLREKNLKLQQAYDELKAAQAQIIEKEKLEKELEISRHIQESILPDSMPVIPGYDFGARMVPARAVGGDFYSFFSLPGGKLGVVVGDVSDKGVPAALFMALSYSLIRAEAVRTRSPVKALQLVNEQLLQMNSSCMFVTLVYGILDCNSGDFHFARAAHPSPFLLDEDGQVIAVPVTPGQPLGLFETLPIDEQISHIPMGGMLLLYSDGVSETQDTKGVDFGQESIHKTLSATRNQSAQGICEELWNQVQEHGRNMPQQDDFTSVVIKRLMT